MRVPKPDRQQQLALTNLANSAGEAYLCAALEDIKSNLVTQSEESVIRTLQGQGRLISELLGLINPSKYSPTSGKR